MGNGCGLDHSLVAVMPGTSAFSKDKLKTACKNLISIELQPLLYVAYILKASKPVNNRQTKELDYQLI